MKAENHQSNPLEPELCKKLIKIVGSQNFLTAPEELLCYSYDALNIQALPQAVIFPDNALEISHIVSWARKYRVPVIPRGAGSGRCGGTVPISGGLVLSTERMSTIRAIDEENLLAIVEPGVVTGDLAQAVAQKGLFYPPDPGSLNYCTIGGNVALNAGGMRAVKYGTTKDYVLGCEAVLGTGEIIRTGVKTLKGVVGYDLTHLLVGSEGTLGILTEIILKVIPLPESTRLLMLAFETALSACQMVVTIFNHRIVPSMVEFLDSTCIELLRAEGDLQLHDQCGSILIVEVDGPVETTERHSAIIQALAAQNGALSTTIAASDTETEAIKQVRRQMSQILGRKAPRRYNEDVTVPRTKLPLLAQISREIGQKHNVDVVSFGHAGDGNLHVSVIPPDNDDMDNGGAKKAVTEILTQVVAMGGTISGEHGIGIAKLPFLELELSPSSIDLMRGIKSIFDPDNILNPGKAL